MQENKGKNTPCHCETLSGEIRATKKQLTDEIVKDVVTIAKCEEKSMSVVFEEIKPNDWAEREATHVSHSSDI